MDHPAPISVFSDQRRTAAGRSELHFERNLTPPGQCAPGLTDLIAPWSTRTVEVPEHRLFSFAFFIQ
jgi:hypothetical protein